MSVNYGLIIVLSVGDVEESKLDIVFGGGMGGLSWVCVCRKFRRVVTCWGVGGGKVFIFVILLGRRDLYIGNI